MFIAHTLLSYISINYMSHISPIFNYMNVLFVPVRCKPSVCSLSIRFTLIHVVIQWLGVRGLHSGAQNRGGPRHPISQVGIVRGFLHLIPLFHWKGVAQDLQYDVLLEYFILSSWKHTSTLGFPQHNSPPLSSSTIRQQASECLEVQNFSDNSTQKHIT